MPEKADFVFAHPKVSFIRLQEQSRAKMTETVIKQKSETGPVKRRAAVGVDRFVVESNRRGGLLQARTGFFKWTMPLKATGHK